MSAISQDLFITSMQHRTEMTLPQKVSSHYKNHILKKLHWIPLSLSLGAQLRMRGGLKGMRYAQIVHKKMECLTMLQ